MSPIVGAKRRYRMLATGVLELVAPLQQGRGVEVVEGLPPDAKVVHVGYGPNHGLGVVLESKAWEPVEARDLNALPRVLLKLRPLSSAVMKFKRRRPDGTDEDGELRVMVDDSATGGKPPDGARVRLAGAEDLAPTLAAARGAAAVPGRCPTCGRGGFHD